MKNSDISKIALKVFSIFVLVQAVLIVPPFLSAYFTLSNGTEFKSAGWFSAVSITSIFLLIVLSIFIWRLSNNVSGQINSDQPASISESFILAVLGLYLIFDSLKRLSITSVGVFYSLESSPVVSDTVIQSIVILAVYFAQLIIGLSLIFGAKGWLKILHKLRVAGT